MDRALLRSRFTRALRRSLLAAMPAAAIACGGQVDTGATDAGSDGIAPNDAVAPNDAGKDVVTFDASGACRSSGIPTTPPACGFSVTLSGDLSTCGFPSDGGAISKDVCDALCGPQASPVYCFWYNGSPNTLQCGQGCEGRRPEGLRPRMIPSFDVVADHFARAAFLEAASIDAFDALHRELVHHRAPRNLRDSAIVARTDEIRHARIMRSIAESYGAIVEKPIVDHVAPRDLEAIAIENAVEGCVRETWGALLATWQADHARTPRVRAAMNAIAREEAEHALLGLRVAQWIDGRLSPNARARVARARHDAIVSLLSELAIEPDETLRDEAGLPTATQSLLLARSLFAELAVVSAA